MNKFFKKSPLLTLLIASALLLPQTAFAQWAVEVVLDVSPTGIANAAALQTIAGATTTTATSTTTTATTLTELNTYLQTGYSGNGLIPLLSAINDKMGKVNSTDAQQGINENMAARERMYDNYMLTMKADATPTQEEFQRACVDISSRMTTPQGGGAAGGAADAFRGARAYAITSEERFTKPAPAATRLADLVRDRGDNGFCSEQDFANDSPGCTKVGDMPGADLRASSITMGATAGASDPTNGSLTAKQQQAALAYIENSLPQPPSIPKDAQRNSDQGKAYMVYLNKFLARTAAGRDAMVGIVSSHAEMPAEVASASGPMLENWKLMKPAWQRIFGPKLKFPDAPSERDMMRFYVMRYAADPEYPAQLAAMSEKSLLMALVQVQALNARINFQMLQRQEDTNKLLFQINNNQLDPVSTAAMNSLAAKIPNAGATPATITTP